VTHLRGRRATRALVPSASAGGVALVLYVIIAVGTTKNANAAGFSIVVGGVLLGLFTLVVAFLITVLISSFVGRRTQP
jgi:predicted membrane protein